MQESCWSASSRATRKTRRACPSSGRPDACSTAPSRRPAWIASDLYVTNAVKHFKWQLRGKRRLHKTPAQREVDACHQWLEREIAAVKPDVIVALGATAARAVISKDFKVSTMRGQFVESPLAPYVFATFHPSALLRLKDEAEKEAAFEQLVGDLKLIEKALSK